MLEEFYYIKDGTGRGLLHMHRLRNNQQEISDESHQPQITSIQNELMEIKHPAGTSNNFNTEVMRCFMYLISIQDELMEIKHPAGISNNFNSQIMRCLMYLISSNETSPCFVMG